MKMWLHKDGYTLVRVNGKMTTEHRCIVEQYLGHPLDPTLDVHHKNGDKTDNRIENLEVISHAQHAHLHARGRATPNVRRPKGIPAWNKGLKTQSVLWVECLVCGRGFQRAAKSVKDSIKRGRRLVCGKVCRTVLSNRASHIPAA